VTKIFFVISGTYSESRTDIEGGLYDENDFITYKHGDLIGM